MMRVILSLFLSGFFSIAALLSLQAQGSIYGFAGGLSLSNEQITGFAQEELIRPHAIAFIESTSDISPNAMYARLGYHVKGAEIQTYTYYDEGGIPQPSEVPTIEFHNLSASVGWKQRRPLGGLWYSYGFGLRLDYNVKADYSKFFMAIDGAENKFTYGVDVDLAMEFPLSEFVSAFVEFGVSPDLNEQIFIPLHNTGWYQYNGVPITVGETKLTNLVYEIRAGIRFWHKVIYTD